MRKERFQYDTTSSAFRREDALSRFIRPSSPRRLLFQVALLTLWTLVLVVIAVLALYW